MTREEAILWMKTLKNSKINWLGEKAEEEDIITRCKEAEQEAFDMAIEALSAEAEADADMGEVSDGYHTFNQLYHQRAVLFATIVKQNKEKAWKSWKHGDGKFCFDSNKEWFIVGVDTPEGSYTYHYEKKYWDMFDCVELEHGKFWDGHTEEDVTRLLSLPSAEPKTGKWVKVIDEETPNVTKWHYECDQCGAGRFEDGQRYCCRCGATMKGEEE